MTAQRYTLEFAPKAIRSLGKLDRATVAINPAKQYQRIAGFGVSEGFGQAKTLMNAPASVQKQVLSLLYSPTRGAGLTKTQVRKFPGLGLDHL